VNKKNGFLIAAPQSGSGKTTVSLAIMAALVRRGQVVAPFKCGPDFIDPGYHSLVTGRPSINLDCWMCPENFVLQTFLTGLTGQAIAVIEGAMGLFDGIGASGKAGSSAEIAAIIGVPTVLVVSAHGMAASSAALINGFAGFDPLVRVAGVIFNNVGSEKHAAILREVLAAHCPAIACFGCVLRDESLAVPSRHLGLVTVEDNPLPDEFITRLADMAERCLCLDRLAGLSFDSPRLRPAQTAQTAVSTRLAYPKCGPESGVEPTVRIAVARDSAFCFMYGDTIRLLQAAGAEIIFFSPLNDAELPADIHGMYLPGGYPELHAGRLNENGSMKMAIRAAVAADMPVYAECGGFMYLTEGLDDTQNQSDVELVGIFPVRARMLTRRKVLGYRQVEFVTGTALGGEGAICRGHEFHYSEIARMPDTVERCFRVSRLNSVLEPEGFRIGNCLASYIHLHFGSNPDIAPSFVDTCRRYKFTS